MCTNCDEGTVSGEIGMQLILERDERLVSSLCELYAPKYCGSSVWPHFRCLAVKFMVLAKVPLA